MRSVAFMESVMPMSDSGLSACVSKPFSDHFYIFDLGDCFTLVFGCRGCAKLWIIILGQLASSVQFNSVSIMFIDLFKCLLESFILFYLLVGIKLKGVSPQGF